MFFLLQLSLLAQNDRQNRTKGYILKADTTYTDTIIGGRDVVYRNIIVYDTVYIVPNIKYRVSSIKNDIPKLVPDTINSEIQYANRFGFWEFEGGISYGMGKLFYPFWKPDDLQNTIKSISYFELFTHASRYYNNWYLKSGLNFSFSQERLKFKRSISEIDSANLNTFTHDTTIIDTAYFLDLEELPDTVYRMYIDTFTNVLVDSVYGRYKKTLSYEPVNRYFRIGIPILVGHLFKGSKIDFALEGGFFINMLVSVNGQTLDYSNNLRQLKEKYFYRLTIDAALRAQFRYKLKSLRYVTFTPVIRYNLINAYSESDFMRKKIISLRFAIGYNFY